MIDKKGWEKKKLSDVCDLITDGVHISPQYEEEGVPMLDSKNIIDGFKIDASNPTKFISNETDRLLSSRCKPKTNDILISSRGSIGKIAIVENGQDFNIMGNIILIRLPLNMDTKFLAYSLFSNVKEFENLAQGVAQKGLYLNQVRNFKIPIPLLPIQQQIVSELDTLSDIISKKKQQLADLDTLAQATFYDMFGDPVSNEKGWNVSKLGKLGSFKNGLNYKTSENGINVKILSVSDFKKNITIKNTELLGFVGLDILPNEEYFLKENDIVFVRSNGSKDLVGRCVLMGLIKEKITFSGFCIRFRMVIHELNSLFLTYILTNEHFKNNLIQQGRGANISNINQQMLNEQLIIMPPISLQNNFTEKIESIEEQKELINKSIEDVQQLFDYTMNRYFN